MQFPASDVRITRGGEIRTQRAQIEMNEYAFSVLSGALYSDRELAVVRELCTNALDSHDRAGTPDRPFDVTLPTAASPNLVIRDYGTSMVPSKVPKLYLNYFKSDKRGDNTQAGGFGLGCKTPLALVDSFLLSTFQRGLRHDYIIVKEEDGCPGISDPVRSATAEPAGAQVTVAIPAGQIRAIREAAARTLAFFPVRPRFLDAAGSPTRFDVPTPRYLIRSTGWGIPEYASGSNWNDTLVVTRPCTFPVDLDRIPTDRLPAEVRSFLNYGTGLHLFLPVGAVTPAPSREALTYTPATIERLATAIAEAYAEFRATVQAQFDALPTLWAARCRSDEFAQMLFDRGIRGPNHSRIVLEWRGRPAANHVFRTLGVRVIRPRGFTGVTHAPGTVQPSSRRRGGITVTDSSTSVFAVPGLTAIYVDDLPADKKHEAGGRVRYHLDENNIDGAYLVAGDDLTPERIERAGCGHLLVNVSTLPKRPIVRTQTPATPPSVRRRHGSGWHQDTALSDRDALAKGGSYLVVEHGKTRWGGCLYDDNDDKITAILAHMPTLLPGRDIVGVTPGMVARLEKTGPWTTLEREIASVAGARIKARKKAIMLALAERAARHCAWFFSDMEHVDIKSLRASSPMRRYLELRHRTRDASRDPEVECLIAIVDRTRLTTALELPAPDPKVVAALNAHADVLALYPLLTVVAWSGVRMGPHTRNGTLGHHYDAIVDYLNHCDRARARAPKAELATA